MLAFGNGPSEPSFVPDRPFPVQCRALSRCLDHLLIVVQHHDIRIRLRHEYTHDTQMHGGVDQVWIRCGSGVDQVWIRCGSGVRITKAMIHE